MICSISDSKKKEQPLAHCCGIFYERTGFYYDVQLMPMEKEKRKSFNASKKKQKIAKNGI